MATRWMMQIKFMNLQVNLRRSVKLKNGLRVYMKWCMWCIVGHANVLQIGIYVFKLLLLFHKILKRRKYIENVITSV